VVLLIYDLASFPTFAVHQLGKNINIVSLVSTKFFSLGTYNTHSICVSLDSIMQRSFLDHVKGSPNAIVITHFVEPGSSKSSEGAL